MLHSRELAQLLPEVPKGQTAPSCCVLTRKNKFRVFKFRAFESFLKCTPIISRHFYSFAFLFVFRCKPPNLQVINDIPKTQLCPAESCMQRSFAWLWKNPQKGHSGPAVPPGAGSSRIPAAAAGTRSWGWHRNAQPGWQPGSCPRPALSLSSDRRPRWWSCGTPRPGWDSPGAHQGQDPAGIPPWDAESPTCVSVILERTHF